MGKTAKPLLGEGFPARLRQERLRLRLTQAQAAAAGGVATQSQIAYEHGTRTPDVDYLTALSRSGFDLWLLLHGVAQKDQVSQTFDWELLACIQQSVSAWCGARGISLSPQIGVEISRLLYDQFAGKFDVQPSTVDRVLRLVVDQA